MKSYFDFKSLAQRHLTETEETFTSQHETPVVIQRMIGEPLGGATNDIDIPVGCVVFTQEPCGKTPGVILIQGAFGHNAGVVDNSVTTDSFYLDPSGNIYASIKQKPQRLVPVNNKGKFELAFKGNTPRLQNSRTLEDNDVRAIGIVAREIERQYQKPMDIELIFDRRTKTIHLVQARPLTLTASFNPQYIGNFGALLHESIISGTTINPDDCSLRQITNKNQLVIAPSLEEALMFFLRAPKEQQDTIAGVVVQNNTSTTSHAAITLRCAHKFIMVTPDTTKLQQWLNTTPTSLFFDLQRGAIVNAPSSSIRMATGWFKHPLPACVSIMPNPSPTTPERFVDSSPEKTILNLFDELKISVIPHESGLILNSILAKIATQIQTLSAELAHPQKGVFVTAEYSRWQRLYAYICQVALHLRETFRLAPQDMIRLYVTNTMEAALFQKQSVGGVNNDSYLSLMEDYIEQSKLATTLTDLHHGRKISDLLFHDYQLFSIARQGTTFALTDTLTEKWIVFIDAIAQAGMPHTASLKNVMETLNKLNALPTFINLMFNKVRSEGATAILAHAAGVLNATKIAPLLRNLQQLNIGLDVYPLDAWGKPKHFADLLTAFQDQFVVFFISHELLDLFDSSSKNTLLQNLALEVMHKFVDTFDRIIKTVKGSVLYENTAKVNAVSTLVKLFFGILEQWSLIIPTEALAYNSRWQLPRYLSKMNEIKEELSCRDADLELLLPTPSFSVANAALGSATDFSLCLPKSWEDFYTTIHQSLLVILGSRAKTAFAAERLDIPVYLLAIHQTIAHLTDPKSNFLIGAHCAGQDLYTRYNIPVANHSVIFEVEYNKGSKETLITIRFVGENSNCRWQQLANFMQAWACLNNLPTPRTIVSEKEIHGTIKITEETYPRWQLRNIFLTMLTTANRGGTSDPSMNFLIEQLKTKTLGEQTTFVEQLKSLPLHPFFWCVFLSHCQGTKLNHLFDSSIQDVGFNMALACLDQQCGYIAKYITAALLKENPVINRGSPNSKTLSEIFHQTASAHFPAEDERIRAGKLMIYTTLVGRGNAHLYQEATNLALQTLLSDNNEIVQKTTQGLINAILSRRDLTPNIIDDIKRFALASATKQTNKQVCLIGLMTSSTLIALKQEDPAFIKPIIELVESLLFHSDRDIRSNALSLLNLLVIHRNYSKESLAALASRCCSIENDEIIVQGLGIYGQLIGNKYQEAYSTAEHDIERIIPMALGSNKYPLITACLMVCGEVLRAEIKTPLIPKIILDTLVHSLKNPNQATQTALEQVLEAFTAYYNETQVDVLTTITHITSRAFLHENHNIRRNCKAIINILLKGASTNNPAQAIAQRSVMAEDPMVKLDGLTLYAASTKTNSYWEISPAVLTAINIALASEVAAIRDVGTTMLNYLLKMEPALRENILEEGDDAPREYKLLVETAQKSPYADVQGLFTK